MNKYLVTGYEKVEVTIEIEAIDEDDALAFGMEALERGEGERNGWNDIGMDTIYFVTTEDGRDSLIEARDDKIVWRATQMSVLAQNRGGDK